MKNIKYGDEMRKNYDRNDLVNGDRGKYYSRYMESHNIVRLDPEIVKVFPSEKDVNDALLSLIKIARASLKKSKKA